MRHAIHSIKLLLALLFVSTAASGAEFALAINDIVSPLFAAHGVRLTLSAGGAADLQIANLKVQQREFHNVRLHCARFTLTSLKLACSRGQLNALPDAVLDIDYAFDTQRLQLSLVAIGGESWQVNGRFNQYDWQTDIELRNAQGKRLAYLMPAAVPTLNQGALNGRLSLSGNVSGLSFVSADMKLADLAFADTSGLHAAEKLNGLIKFTARRNAAVWRWQGSVIWQSGELFWQPLYLRGRHELSASGRFETDRLDVEQAVLDLPHAGRLYLTASMRQDALLAATLHGDGLPLDVLFGVYARPFMEKGALAESSLSGVADVDAQYRDGELKTLHLNLHNAGISEAEQRFSLFGVNSDIAWQADAPGAASIAFAGGALLGANIGSGQWTVNMRGLAFDMPQATLPLLDGTLELRDFHLHRAAVQPGKSCGDCKPAWHWRFAGGLTPVSMEKVSQAAGWPKMLGTLAGRIPDVSYDGNEISADGALLFNVFDGAVVATKMKLADAFGRVPRLSGNLTMRNLDLDLLTRTFSFGNMQGRLDGDVNDLQLQNWQPVRFDARLYSSPGTYPKKISQKAVQNISSLGGAGAAAAIQRSYLGFFENFGYDRIALGCVLRNDVCTMSGIDGVNQGSYAIIRGGGIPAISVIGYNRTVSWGELIARLKRVTQDNVTPVVK